LTPSPRTSASGTEYVVCSTILHSAKHLAEKDVQPAADNLNRWGERLRIRLRSSTTRTAPSLTPPDGTVSTRWEAN
jgi:hypothetical protein